jgi:hypothetical protein
MKKFFAKIYNRLFIYSLADQRLVRELQQISKGRPVSCAVMTKPLQFMNLKGADRDSDCCKILFFADYFFDSVKFVEHLKKTDSEWDAIILLPNEKTAFSCILQLENVSEIWLACDYGVTHNFFMAEMHSRNSKVKLIEEGVGNYTGNVLGFAIFHPWLNKHRLIANLSFIPLRNLLNFISGSGRNLNESQWTDEVHLYFPGHPSIPCRNKDVFRKIKKTPAENFSGLVEFFDFSSYPELEKLHDFNILIFAMNYSDTPDFSQEDYDKYDFLIAKYHPHVKLPPPATAEKS